MRHLPVILMLIVLSISAHCDTETVTVDLAATRGPSNFRASGFLHGMSPSAPPQDLVQPLKPRLFRATARDVGLVDGPGIYERATAMGAKIHMDLSSSYGCSATGQCPGDGGDWSKWDKIIDYLLSVQKQKGYRVQWDIWNEPNLSEYWARDHDRYLEMWRRTVVKIRAADPNAEIVGPDICGYSGEWLQRFLLWTKANGVLPDIICWHEFDKPRDIPAHAAELRRFLKENRIPIKRFSLNEIIGGHHLTKPGPTAFYLWAVEDASIESAAHACWEDKQKGVYGCWTDSLDGIIVPRELKPRSTWWVYRRYADVTGTLVRVDSSASACGIASRDDAKREIALLLGRDASAKGDIRVRFANLDGLSYLRDKVRVIVECIPDSGWEHLPKPEVIQDCVRPLFGSDLTVIVPDLGPSDACFVRVGACR